MEPAASSRSFTEPNLVDLKIRLSKFVRHTKKCCNTGEKYSPGNRHG